MEAASFVRDRLDGQAIYIRKDARTGQWTAYIAEYHDLIKPLEFSATADDPVAAIVRLARELQQQLPSPVDRIEIKR